MSLNKSMFRRHHKYLCLPWRTLTPTTMSSISHTPEKLVSRWTVSSRPAWIPSALIYVWKYLCIFYVYLCVFFTCTYICLSMLYIHKFWFDANAFTILENLQGFFPWAFILMIPEEVPNHFDLWPSLYKASCWCTKLSTSNCRVDRAWRPNVARKLFSFSNASRIQSVSITNPMVNNN